MFGADTARDREKAGFVDRPHHPCGNARCRRQRWRAPVERNHLVIMCVCDKIDQSGDERRIRRVDRVGKIRTKVQDARATFSSGHSLGRVISHPSSRCPSGKAVRREQSMTVPAAGCYSRSPP